MQCASSMEFQLTDGVTSSDQRFRVNQTLLGIKKASGFPGLSEIQSRQSPHSRVVLFCLGHLQAQIRQVPKSKFPKSPSRIPPSSVYLGRAGAPRCCRRHCARSPLRGI